MTIRKAIWCACFLRDQRAEWTAYGWGYTFGFLKRILYGEYDNVNFSTS